MEYGEFRGSWMKGIACMSVVGGRRKIVIYGRHKSSHALGLSRRRRHALAGVFAFLVRIPPSLPWQI